MFYYLIFKILNFKLFKLTHPEQRAKIKLSNNCIDRVPKHVVQRTKIHASTLFSYMKYPIREVGFGYGWGRTIEVPKYLVRVPGTGSCNHPPCMGTHATQ